MSITFTLPYLATEYTVFQLFIVAYVNVYRLRPDRPWVPLCKLESVYQDDSCHLYFNYHFWFKSKFFFLFSPFQT